MTGTVAGDVLLPGSHLDLFERPVIGVMTTLARDGAPASSLVWVDHDGTCVRVNTTLERRKARDVVRDPRVTILVVDPEDASRFVQVRGVAELVIDGAEAHLDALTRRYTPHPAFYGHVHPDGRRRRDTRVICRIHPRRVTLDAIHR
jgi:PPOX class probable F420-dependent enzyme